MFVVHWRRYAWPNEGIDSIHHLYQAGRDGQTSDQSPFSQAHLHYVYPRLTKAHETGPAIAYKHCRRPSLGPARSPSDGVKSTFAVEWRANPPRTTAYLNTDGVSLKSKTRPKEKKDPPPSNAPTVRDRDDSVRALSSRPPTSRPFPPNAFPQRWRSGTVAVEDPSLVGRSLVRNDDCLLRQKGIGPSSARDIPP